MPPRRLTLADIADARAYERERPEFRARIIELKQLRRVPIGPLVTLTFENFDTMRFQVQEMARAEKLYTDAAIEAELEVYNRLIPSDGRLVATLFVELTSKEELVEWLPKLVGIQRAPRFILADGTVVLSEPQDEERLTREDVTASVHYVEFAMPPGATLAGAVLEVDHPDYQHAVVLSPEQAAELERDLRS